MEELRRITDLNTSKPFPSFVERDRIRYFTRRLSNFLTIFDVSMDAGGGCQAFQNFKSIGKTTPFV